MASLDGTYQNPITGETLIISNSNDSNGTFSGTLSGQVDGLDFQADISGGYHFFNSVGEHTSISFTAIQASTNTQPELREVWAGTSVAHAYSQLEMMGVRSILKNNEGERVLYAFCGPFNRK